jgi:hypothetical protein
MNPALSMTVVRAFRRTVVPLASYYAVTLGLPLANGAAQSGAAFVEHALVVLVVPPIVIVLACTVRGVAHAFRRSCWRSTAGAGFVATTRVRDESA